MIRLLDKNGEVKLTEGLALHRSNYPLFKRDRVLHLTQV